jgi:ABC-2 type transport system permease protein
LVKLLEPLAGILQFLYGFNQVSFMFAARFFELTWGQQRVSPELMEQAQQEFAGTAQMYIKELWNLPIASILNKFYSLFHRWLLLTALLCAIGAAVDNQTDSQQFPPIIMPLMLSVYVVF